MVGSVFLLIFFLYDEGYSYLFAIECSELKISLYFKIYKLDIQFLNFLV